MYSEPANRQIPSLRITDLQPCGLRGFSNGVPKNGGKAPTLHFYCNRRSDDSKVAGYLCDRAKTIVTINNTTPIAAETRRSRDGSTTNAINPSSFITTKKKVAANKSAKN